MNVFNLSHKKSALKIHISFFLLFLVAQCTLWKMTHFSPRPLDIQTAKPLLLTNALLKDFPLALLALLGKHIFWLALEMHLCITSKSKRKRFWDNSCQAAEVNFRLTSKLGQEAKALVCRGWHVLGQPKHGAAASSCHVCSKTTQLRRGMLIQYSWWHWRGCVFWLLWIILLF